MLTTPRVVVLRPGAMGDALLSVPALAALRRHWPAAHITLAARADVLPLIAATGLADSTLSFDDPLFSALWRDDPPLGSGALVGLLGGADAVVAWVRDGEGVVTRNLRALGVREIVVAPGRPTDADAASGPSEHVARYLLLTLAPLGVVDAARSLAELAAQTPLLVPPSAAAARADQLWRELLTRTVVRTPARGEPAPRVVALHPGSGGAAKRWPAERFAALAARLWQAGYPPLIVAGPADGEALAQMLGSPALAASEEYAGGPTTLAPLVVRDLPVSVLASVLARCHAFAGNDSGVSHLVALVGCPTLVLFGPTDPAMWEPVGRRMLTLRAPMGADGICEMGALTVDAVWGSLVSLLEAGVQP